jgi:hypothetical protein
MLRFVSLSFDLPGTMAYGPCDPLKVGVSYCHLLPCYSISMSFRISFSSKLTLITLEVIVVVLFSFFVAYP